MKKFLLATTLIFSHYLFISPFSADLIDQDKIKQARANLAEKLIGFIQHPTLENFVARIVARNFGYLIDTGDISNQELDKRADQFWHDHKKEYFKVVKQTLQAELTFNDLFPDGYLEFNYYDKKLLVNYCVDNLDFEEIKLYEDSFKLAVRQMNKSYQLYKKQKNQ